MSFILFNEYSEPVAGVNAKTPQLPIITDQPTKQSHLLTSAQTNSTYNETLSEHLLPLLCWLEGAFASSFLLPFLEKATFTLAIGRVLKTLPLLYLLFKAGALRTILPLPMSVSVITIALENYHQTMPLLFHQLYCHCPLKKLISYMTVV